MRIERQDGDRERRILIGMIVNDTVLGRVSSRWDGSLFAGKPANTLAGLCVDYYRSYSKAPRKNIVNIFSAWSEKNQDDESIKFMDRFLSGLSNEYEMNGELNPDQVSDAAGRLFNTVRLKRLVDHIQGYLDLGQVDNAELAVTKFSRVEMGVGSGVDLFIDLEAMRSTYARELREPLILYPGDLGNFFGDYLARDNFIIFWGTEKSGKSFFLLDMAYRAMCQRRKVAYFQAGDLSEHQIKDRFLVRAAKHPSRSTQEDRRWPCRVLWPTSIMAPNNEDEFAWVKRDSKEFAGPINSQENWDEKITKIIKRETNSDLSYFRLSCHPTKSISVLGIQSILESWELHGFHADVVIIDYADILCPVNKQEEKREQVKTTHEHLRQLSQRLHCLLVSASQVNAQSYMKRTLDRSNFSENHLKLAEGTGIIGINQVNEEKERGVCRLNWIVRREGEYSSRRCIHVAQCLALSYPTVRSVFAVSRSRGRNNE